MSVSRNLLILLTLALMAVVVLGNRDGHRAKHRGGHGLKHRGNREQGHCQGQYQLCQQVYSPVCASDGHTYSNNCEFKRAKCTRHWLRIVKRGRCEEYQRRHHVAHEDHEDRNRHQHQRQHQGSNVHVDVGVEQHQNQELRD